MEGLLNLDVQLFYLLNVTLANQPFDLIMPFVTNLKNWYAPIAVLIILLLAKGGKRGRMAVLLLIPTIIFCDQISASVVKPWVGRIRPCHTLQDIRVLVGCGGKLAFPSSHATNMAGIATVFTFFYRRYWMYFGSFAGLIGFSRIYVGKHYPLDVIGGFLLGWLLAMLMLQIYRQLSGKFSLLKLE